MVFTGTGAVWNPKKNKAIVNFNETPEYETEDAYEIEILSACCESCAEDENKPIKLGKKDIIEILTKRGIDFSPRDKKEVLESLMYQE